MKNFFVIFCALFTGLFGPQALPGSGDRGVDSATASLQVKSSDPQTQKDVIITTDPYKIGTQGLLQPELIKHPLPRYTEEARKARVEGLVVLQAVIRTNGRADTFKVIKGLGYGLDEAAIDAISHEWKFKPGMLNGEPVNVQVNIEVTFRLYDKPPAKKK